ncbi:hypothetical protein [Bradyrhizobium sp. USDA 223]|uniref:hypothetical protein n=1 Tax=Bradyrhizobium sp. USDA 223 TaxID=3156306 RepID=UPI003836A815
MPTVREYNVRRHAGSCTITLRHEGRIGCEVDAQLSELGPSANIHGGKPIGEFDPFVAELVYQREQID